MHPELFAFSHHKIVHKNLGHLMVNGPLTELGTNLKPVNIVPTVPQIISTESSESKSYVSPTGWRDIYVNEGAKSFAKAIRDHTKNTHEVFQWTLQCEVIFRFKLIIIQCFYCALFIDAHQSLLATRMEMCF